MFGSLERSIRGSTAGLHATTPPTGASDHPGAGLGARPARPRLHRLLLAAYALLGVGTLLVATSTQQVADAISLQGAPGPLGPAWAGVVFWTLVCLVTTDLVARGSRIDVALVASGPVMAAALLGGPVAGGWVALLGTVRLADLRDGSLGETLGTQSMLAFAAVASAIVMVIARPILGLVLDFHFAAFAGMLAGTAVWLLVTQGMSLLLWHARTGRTISDGIAVVSHRDWAIAATADVCVAFMVAWAYDGGVTWPVFVLLLVEYAAGRSMTHHLASWQLRHHHLTGLPNGKGLREHVARLDRHADVSMTCAYLDLNGFKAVNDDLGHDVGDEVLCDCAQRLGAVASDTVFVAHLHGDEFVVLAPAPADAGPEGVLGDRLHALFERPFEHAGHELSVGVSVGTAALERGPDGHLDLDGALRSADRRMADEKVESWKARGLDRRRS